MKNRRTSPMKGKKYSAEHLEERRRRKAEREERWKLVKEGWEVKKIYSAFMHQPHWMTHIRKEALIKALSGLIEEEKEMAAALEKASKFNSTPDDFDYKTASTEDILARSKRITDSSKLYLESCKKRNRLYELEFLLSLFQPKDAVLKQWYGEAAQVHPDFSVYCRDN